MNKMSVRNMFLMLFSFIFLFILSHPASAGSSLTLPEAIQIALKNRYELNIADQNILKSKAKLIEANSELYPRLDFLGNSGYIKTLERFEPTLFSFDLMGTTYTISPTKDVPEYQSDISLQLTQRLFAGGKIVKGIEGAKERVSQSEIAKELNKRNIMIAVINSYWELKRAEKWVEIGKEKVSQSETILDIAKVRYGKGAISGLEKDNAEIDLINNRRDLVHSETKRKIAVDILLNEMGIIEAKEYQLTLIDEPILDPANDERRIDEFIEIALSKRLELQRLKKEIKIKDAEKKVALGGYYPNIDLQGEYNWVGYDRDNLNKSWQDIHENYWSVFLKVRWNLFEGFYTKGKVNQAQAELSSAQLEMERQKQNIIQEIKEAYNNLIGAIERIEVIQKNITLTERSLKAAKKQFELGIIDTRQVIEYNNRLADVKKPYFDALVDYAIAKAKLKWATGDDLL